MTAKEQLHLLVDAIPDAEAEAMLVQLQEWAAERGGVVLSDKPRTWPLAFAGIIDSGQPDFARTAKDVIRAELGRQ